MNENIGCSVYVNINVKFMWICNADMNVDTNLIILSQLLKSIIENNTANYSK